jgi:hypothetical protein
MTFFEERLKEGQLGESAIANFLISRGWGVLPAYQVETDSGKGPRLFGGFGQLICPDLLVFRGSKVYWIEAKHKSSFTWHRLSQTWQTGIDKRHWLDYLRVGEQTPFPVWLLFLHRNGMAKDTPEGLVSPSGLYGNSISYLRDNVHHESAEWGHSGMVYWTEGALKRIGAVEPTVEPRELRT